MLDVLADLPLFGVGVRMSKDTWFDESYWHIVHVHPKVKSFAAAPADVEGAVPELRAKVYGVKYWNGVAETGRVKRIRGHLKDGWRRVGVQDSAQQMAAFVDSLDKAWQQELGDEGAAEASPADEQPPPATT